MQKIDKRAFLISGFAAMGAAAVGAAPRPGGRIEVFPDRVLNTLPVDYVGFSVEKAQFSDPAYYHPGNASLIAHFRRLSRRGVLRIGGNTSDFSWWKAAPGKVAPPIRSAGWGRADNTMPQSATAIAPQAVQALRDFLDACGWSCIWGLNLGTAAPDANAAEAAFVARTLGPRLRWFQIGNEPDFYGKPNTRLRPENWDFAAYLNDWTAHAKAVQAAVPSARFAGPDVGSNRDWIVQFAAQVPKRLGAAVAGLSGHYYWSGPPEAPQVTIPNLLAPAPGVAARMDAIAQAARAARLPFRMTEGNTCFRGGKPGLSDAFASALWGADYMLTMAAHGCQGVHFHGGSGAVIANSLGGKLPGAQNAADHKAAEGGAFYAPLAGNRTAGFAARPLFYGMMLAEQFAGARLLATRFETAGVNAAAFAARTASGGCIAVINKDAGRDLPLEIALNGLGGGRAEIWRLTAPSLAATAGVRFAGADVAGGTARWQPDAAATADVRSGRIDLYVPHASAALIRLNG